MKKKRSKPATAKLGQDILKGMREMQAWAKGEVELRTRNFNVPEEIDVKAIREKLGLSQAQFAIRYCFSPRTLQQWEQGRSKPDNTARAYLTVIDNNPDAVAKALGG